MTPMKNIAIIKLLTITILSFSCISKDDPIAQLCETYNKKTPIKIDNSTTLISTTCTDKIFSFDYELDHIGFNDGERFILETMLKENLIKSVNKIDELTILKKRNFKLGYIYYNKNKKPEITIMFYINEIGDFEYDENLSQRLHSKLLESHNSID